MSRAKTTPTRSFVHVGCARLFCYRSCEVAEVAAPARSMELFSDLTQTFIPCLTP
jgi:hypothetical protein